MNYYVSYGKSRFFVSILDESYMTPYHKVIWKSIHHLLLAEWDPLNLGVSAPADEYQSYIPDVFRLKIENASLDAMSNHLLMLERTNLGLEGEERRCRNVAMKIIRL